MYCLLWQKSSSFLFIYFFFISPLLQHSILSVALSQESINIPSSSWILLHKATVPILFSYFTVCNLQILPWHCFFLLPFPDYVQQFGISFKFTANILISCGLPDWLCFLFRLTTQRNFCLLLNIWVNIGFKTAILPEWLSYNYLLLPFEIFNKKRYFVIILTFFSSCS